MDKLTIISGCLFLAADIFAIASVANPDWINTGGHEGKKLYSSETLSTYSVITLSLMVRPLFYSLWVRHTVGISSAQLKCLNVIAFDNKISIAGILYRTGIYFQANRFTNLQMYCPK